MHEGGKLVTQLAAQMNKEEESQCETRTKYREFSS